MKAVSEICEFLDRLLANDRFSDSAHNGLQVQNSGRLGCICCGVDASLPFLEEAARRGAGLVVCHHGLSWGDSLKRITGLNYTRIRFLIEHDIALYAAHLPLDAHRRYGNNALLCRLLGGRDIKPFCHYHGQMIGFRARLPKAVPVAAVEQCIRSRVNARVEHFAFGKPTIRSVAAVSGGGGFAVREAAEAGVDLLLSGEATLQAFHEAREYGIHVVFAGHYATERFGVEALGRMLQKRFGVSAGFVDEGIKV